MICMTTLRKVFRDKLEATDSMDAAFTKAVWIAYKQGLKDAEADNVVKVESVHERKTT